MSLDGCAIVLLAAAAIVTTGCGGDSSTVRLAGQITIDGQALPADAIGSISFQPTADSQGSSAGAPIEGGRYEIEKAPKGLLRTVITVQQPTGRMIDNGRGDPAPEYDTIVTPESSLGIEIEVTDDDDELNFDLARKSA